MRSKLERTDLPFRLNVLTNARSDSPEVCIQSRDGQQWSEQTTDMRWPEGIASLSHVAVPFPLDDPVYGRAQGDFEEKLHLGELSLLSEPSALMIASSLFLRCRHNPFYQFMEDYVVDWYSKVCPPSFQRSE